MPKKVLISAQSPETQTHISCVKAKPSHNLTLPRVYPRPAYTCAISTRPLGTRDGYICCSSLAVVVREPGVLLGECAVGNHRG